MNGLMYCSMKHVRSLENSSRATYLKPGDALMLRVAATTSLARPYASTFNLNTIMSIFKAPW